VIRYAAVRLALVLPVLVVVSFFTFILMHLLPGNPVDVICGTGCTAQGRAELTRQLGFNRPILSQYFLYIGHALSGNLGHSYITNQNVSTMLAQHLPITLELMVLSQIFALALAVPLAIYSALHPDSRFDRGSSVFSFGLLAIPSFVVGVFLVLAFAVKVHVFPATGFTNLTANPAQNLRDLVLPTITLGIGSVAVYQRILRSDLVATFQEDFITMARAKGLSTRYIVWRHAMRPSMLTFVTLAGLNIGTLIGGAFIVEVLFQLPGIGYMTVTAINQSDYLVVQGVVLVVTTGFVVVLLLADILNALLDPRIRLTGTAAK
jgi:peptide/nickel transport system permease protein